MKKQIHALMHMVKDYKYKSINAQDFTLHDKILMVRNAKGKRYILL